MILPLKFPKGSFFHPMQHGMGLEIYLDPNLGCCGSFGYSYQHKRVAIRVRELKGGDTYMHEFVHAFQILSGTGLGKEKFRFTRQSLEKYCRSRGLYFSNSSAEYVEQLLEEMIAKGLYAPEEFSIEFPAFYVENALDGEKVFEAIWADAKKFMKRRNSFWRQVQKEKRKEKRREWIKDNLIHFPLPFILVLLLIISFATRKDEPIFYNPLPDQVIQK
jgi:hypothetical protein